MTAEQLRIRALEGQILPTREQFLKQRSEAARADDAVGQRSENPT